MAIDHSNIRVLVTGASGYLGTHCVQLLLDEGYLVRGTVRSLKNEQKVKPLKDLRHAPERLELYVADLEQEASWTGAVKDCDYVLHTASPFPIVTDDSIIKTAVDGTLFVLRACSKEKSVKKVVLTSSCAAVNEGHSENRTFDEKDWTVVDNPKVQSYPRSKTIAEKAAWDFVKSIPQSDNKFPLTCINPTLIVGPILMDTQGSSITIIKRFLNNDMPGVPALHMPLVDVRDVAEAHVRAMTTPESDGERILVTYQPSFWFKDIATVLRKEFRPQGYWLPCFTVPHFFLRFYSIFDEQAGAILDRVNKKSLFDNSKADRILGIKFRNPEHSLVEMAYDMIERGILPKKAGYKGRPESTIAQ